MNDYVAGYPSPLPVRESAVYPVPNQQVMGLPEHQIRLSKRGYRLIRPNKGLSNPGEGQPHPKRKKATVAVAFGNLV